jgi:hypothetical protein
LTTAVVVLMALVLAWSVLNYFNSRWWTFSGTLFIVLESVVTQEIGGIALWLSTRNSTS